jgi:hypothetical protein
MGSGKVSTRRLNASRTPSTQPCKFSPAALINDDWAGPHGGTHSTHLPKPKRDRISMRPDPKPSQPVDGLTYSTDAFALPTVAPSSPSPKAPWDLSSRDAFYVRCRQFQ